MLIVYLLKHVSNIEALVISYTFTSRRAAQALGLPFLSPYLQSLGSDYKHGVNFATSASTVLQPNTSLFVSGISPFSLNIQINQMKQFKAKVDELHSSGMEVALYIKLDLLVKLFNYLSTDHLQKQKLYLLKNYFAHSTSSIIRAILLEIIMKF